MKHTVKVTLILIALFFAAQIVGLFTVNKYINIETDEAGDISIVHADTIVGEQPDLDQHDKSYTFLALIVMVLIGTGLLFILIRFRLRKVWKLWFWFAIAMTLTISFDVYLPGWFAIGLGVFFGIIRVWKPNPIIHNFTEIFVYTGITILILPLLNLFSATFLLILISGYDMFAVWKSKHMIKLAEFQIESKSFAGLSMSYQVPKTSKKGTKTTGTAKTAILGGGDIAFPLLFAAAVMEDLIISHVPKLHALGFAFLITVGAGIALSLLLFNSQKDKFYPAMPFISAGCFIGYGIMIVLL